MEMLFDSTSASDDDLSGSASEWLISSARSSVSRQTMRAR